MMTRRLTAFGTIFVIMCVHMASSSPTYARARRNTAGTVTAAWKGKEADILFLLDTSASVWIKHYRDMGNFVAGMVQEMDIGPDKTRVGVALYEENYHGYINVNNSYTKTTLMSKIQHAPYIIGNGYLSRGIEGVKDVGLSKWIARTGVPSIAVVFTDGPSRYKQLALNNATLAKEAGIFLFMVGVGSEVDTDELRKMASDPKSSYYYYASSFERLGDIREKLMTSLAEVEYFQGDGAGTCGDATVVDTLFVYDDYSLSREESSLMIQLIMNAADRFSMGTGNARIGAIATNNRNRDFMLGHFVRRDNLKNMLLSEQQEPSPLADLVSRATTSGFSGLSGARPRALRRLVLVLDRKMTRENSEALLWEVLRAKYDDIQIFVVQLGEDVDEKFLHLLATKQEWVFNPRSLKDLMPARKGSDDFFSEFCKDVTRRRRTNIEIPNETRRPSNDGPSNISSLKSNLTWNKTSAKNSQSSLASTSSLSVLVFSLLASYCWTWSTQDYT